MSLFKPHSMILLIYIEGKITEGSLPHRLFTQRGWDWGNWNDIQDYQHVEKRANGEKRDPDGYSNLSLTNR
ncbi:MAG: hypothetical protein CK426_06290 [Legionella sp.]|nr:MAG: hypothetical protein CK423_02510 [Legionella sp.]PJD98499.1 MAG: hypothetical protein CK426_06290 [Legionella sp.]